jgi:hypothetical protein
MKTEMIFKTLLFAWLSHMANLTNPEENTSPDPLPIQDNAAAMIEKPVRVKKFKRKLSRRKSTRPENCRIFTVYPH